MTIWIGLLTTFWLLYAVKSWFAVGAVPNIEDVPVSECSDDLPSVTIVIASRDEGQRVETTVRRLTAQRGLELQVVLVDDRSNENEAARLRALAGEDERIRLLRIDTLPDGWLGKCNALERGAELADSEWILFSDADTWMAPDLIARSIAEARRTGADHLCLIPSDKRLTFFGHAATLSMVSGFLIAAADVNQDRRFGTVGVGAFNLVKRGAYRSVGGHKTLRMEILDDAMLGALLRQNGFRSRCRIGYPHIEIHWAATVADLPRVLEKNAFAMTGYRTWLVASLVSFIILLWAGALFAPLYAGPSGVSATLALWSLALPAARTARRYRQSALPTLLSPLMLPVTSWVITRSTWVTLRNGGVHWRDTFYPLEALRRGSVPMFPRE
jgi:glycosyltransferase involved in cell wall biosynthesis